MSTISNLLTADEVAPLVRLHRDTVYRLAREGVIRSVLQGRQRRIPRAAVDEYLAKCEEAAAAAIPAAAAAGEPEPRPARPARNPKRTYRT